MINEYSIPDGYICDRCGRQLDPEEVCCQYDDTMTCRYCDGDVQPAYHCEICDELTNQDNIYGYDHKVCFECIEKRRYNVELLKKVGDRSYKTDLDLNSYLCRFFSEDEINELMLEALKERAKIKLVDGIDYLHFHFNEAADVLFEDKNG